MDKTRAEAVGRKAAEIARKTFFVAIPLPGGGWCLRFDANNFESRIFPDHHDTDDEVVAVILSGMKEIPTRF